MARVIVHADLDAFYASVEQLDNPELKGKPVIVGGTPAERGVVAAASYEARRFGARSAMPTSRALRLCPQAILLPPRFGRYAEISRRIMELYRSITPLVEPVSLDEAFLDATEQVRRYAGPENLARFLKGRVRELTGLTVSVGVGTNKTVAKIASDLRKPDGLLVVPPGAEAGFLAPLRIRSLWGIGPKTEQLLAGAGIRTIGHLASVEMPVLARLLGNRAEAMQMMARGEDTRPVIPEHEHKSIGAETTFARDLADGPELRRVLAETASEVAERLRRAGTRAGCVTLKLRYADFRTITRQRTLSQPVDDPETLAQVGAGLLDAVATAGDRFRLLGVQASRLSPPFVRQAALWEEG